MAESYTKYAILTRRTEMQMHQSAELPCDTDELQCFSSMPGTLIKVFQTKTPNLNGSSSGSKLSTVQVLDFVSHSPIFENLYECPQANLLKVCEELWPYVISITDPDRRLSMAQQLQSNRWILYLKINDFVRVSGELFGNKNLHVDCIIRYIGPVEELNPVGYFFGLELLTPDSVRSPQSENIPFAQKYMTCEPSLAIFTTADWVSVLPNEEKKKFSAFDFVSGTIDKVRTAIAPVSCASGTSNTSSLRRPKKPKKKEPTAQFYDVPQSEYIDEAEQLQLALAMEHSEKNTNNNGANGTYAEALIMPPDCEDFKQTIENYEKSLERQHANGMPASILKHRRAPASNGVTAKESKPLNITTLQDRDIVVIDNADIRESTKNESNVIVLDKKRQTKEIDLVDVLGLNWPSMAGDAATMLSKPLKQQEQQFAAAGGGGGSSNSSVSSMSQSRAERNKSPNPLAHLGQKSYSNVAAGHDASLSTAKKYTNIASAAPLYDNLVDADAAVPTTAAPLVLPEQDFAKNSPLQELPDCGLGVGSMVEVSLPEAAEDLYGVIRWIGMPPMAKGVMVGIELEEDQADKQIFTTDGSFNGVALFKCQEGRALFVTPEHCAHDRRFVEADGAVGSKSNVNLHTSESKMFGQVECPPVAGAVAPIKIFNLDGLEEICGKFKGIQGHHNSCYLDATLFAMFTFTSVFDSLLFRPPEPEDIPNYAEVQKVLREEIVNPLRKNVFVRADRVMKLRQLLDKLSSVSGLTSEEKDPEEFLNSLLAQIMRVEPFLKLSSGQDAFFYQLFVEKDERLSFPTVQQLFEQSFHSSDIKLKEVPSCLIIQMPRFGKNYKMYPRILPSQVLDVTDIIEDSPRQCTVCGKLAEYECRDCFGNMQGGTGLESTAFCRKCLDTVHMHTKRANHSSKKLSVPQDFKMMAEHVAVQRVYMELFAVVCIETSHYVAFVKAGSDPDAPWCFFDSMADRKGEQNGYNIPEMITVPDLPLWLSEEGARAVNETSSNDKMLPEHAKRLFCDAYMCMYQSTDVIMYR